MVSRIFRAIAEQRKAVDGPGSTNWRRKPQNAPCLAAGVPKAIAVRRFIAYIARNPHSP
jgi:hypothetical protein